MGYRSTEACHEALHDAALVNCSQAVGISAAGTVRCTGVSGAAGGYVLNMETTAASGAVTATAVQMPQIPCDGAERFNDLAQLFAIALPAVLGVFLVREFIWRLVAPQ
jgi:hypothetical protein